MTLRFAVLGDPVSHSLSPLMHSAALAEAGLDGVYEYFQCDESGFVGRVQELRDGLWSGFNVTMPHKQLAFRMCDLLTTESAKSESVNTLKMTDGALAGHSTDVIAFTMLFSEFESAPLLVLGSGGSAAAAIAAAPSDVYLAARNRNASARLVDRFSDGRVVEIPFGARVSGALVINATPLGMHSEPLPTGLLDSASGLIDLPYGTRPTPAVQEATSKRLPTCDGYRFLSIQAAESFLWWTGYAADAALMETAARNG